MHFGKFGVFQSPKNPIFDLAPKNKRERGAGSKTREEGSISPRILQPFLFLYRWRRLYVVLSVLSIYGLRLASVSAF